MKTALKIIAWFCLAVFLFPAATVLSQENTGEQQPAAGAPAKPGLTTVKPTGGTLTDEQIAALLPEWTDEKTGNKLVFQASFSVRSLPPQEKRRYVKSGKIPARLTCELLEVKEVNGKMLAKRVTNGMARFYIMDPDGKVIDKKSISLDKMCPS